MNFIAKCKKCGRVSNSTDIICK